MGEKKKMENRLGKRELSKTEGQGSFVKKETITEGKLGQPQQETSLKQVRDTIRKLKALEAERRLTIAAGISMFLGKEVTVDSMGMCTPFDLGVMKVLEEAQERGLLYKMSVYRFSGFAEGLFERVRREKATEEQKKQMDESNAVFLKFFQELQNAY
jgi:hypothetical protein